MPLSSFSHQTVRFVVIVTLSICALGGARAMSLDQRSKSVNPPKTPDLPGVRLEAQISENKRALADAQKKRGT
ncbi:MAG: hypothetical protein LQ342_006968 [Letrouitia transgressa]|nr:MAG: hypothetical protein LQ342_006968 [Letrouitia transgressa]